MHFILFSSLIVIGSFTIFGSDEQLKLTIDIYVHIYYIINVFGVLNTFYYIIKNIRFKPGTKFFSWKTLFLQRNVPPYSECSSLYIFLESIPVIICFILFTWFYFIIII